MYLFIDNDDIRTVEQFMGICGIQFFDKNGRVVKDIVGQSFENMTFYIGSEQNHQIHFLTASRVGQQLDAAQLYLGKGADKESRSNFNMLSRFIKNNMHYNDVLQAWIGSSAYKKWKNNEMLLPVLLDYSSFSLDSQTAKEAYKWAVQEGYYVDYLVVDGEPAIISEKVFPDSFYYSPYKKDVVIYCEDSALEVQTRGHHSTYTNNSEAIFCYEEKKNVRFCLDSRITLFSLISLFKTLEKQFGDKKDNIYEE